MQAIQHGASIMSIGVVKHVLRIGNEMSFQRGRRTMRLADMVMPGKKTAF